MNFYPEPVQPMMCQFTLAIEYRDPKAVLNLVRKGLLPKDPASQEDLLKGVETHIHTMQTSCEAAFAVPHFQDVVIADAVKTYGNVAQEADGAETEESVASFRTIMNGVIITLFAKHGALGLCALSEIKLQLNDLGHLSAWNPENHAGLLQSRANAFSAYFYQRRYASFKIIALVTAGGGAPAVGPLGESAVQAEAELSVDTDGTIIVDNTSEIREDTPTGAEVASLTNPQKSSTPSVQPNEETHIDVNITPQSNAFTTEPDGKDRRNFRVGATITELTVAPSQTFSRFGRDFSPATHARVSDRTLSVLGFGDVAVYRDILLKVCSGTLPLFARPGIGEFSAVQSGRSKIHEVPTTSFADDRGVVIAPSKYSGRGNHNVRVDNHSNNSIPDGLRNMLQVYVNDPQKLNTEPIQYTTTASKVEEARKEAASVWAPRKVVALQVRASASASVVVVEFSRKQEANDFKRYLESFQKFPFLNVFKIQPARQLIGDSSQFLIVGGHAVQTIERKIHAEEVTIDHVLSSVHGLISKNTPLSGSRPDSQLTSGATDSASVASSPAKTDYSASSQATPIATLPSHVFGKIQLVVGNEDASKKYILGDQRDIMLRMFEVLLSNAGKLNSNGAQLFQNFIGSPLAVAITVGIPHLGGPTRKLGEEANDTVDFKSLEAALLRIQSEAIGTAQIKNPTQTVLEIDRIFADAIASIESLTKAATQKQNVVNNAEAEELLEAEPLPSSTGSWTVSAGTINKGDKGKANNRTIKPPKTAEPPQSSLAQLQASVAADRKLLLSLEGTLLMVATYLSPLAVYTRTFLCDMGVCRSRTLGRINRGLTRLCISKAMSLMDGLISAATASKGSRPAGLVASVENDMWDSTAKLLPFRQNLVAESRALDFSISNVILNMALLFGTIASNWESLFEKADHMSKVPEHSDRWQVGPSDRTHIEVRPLFDQTLRLVQVSVIKIMEHTDPANEAELMRALFITVCQRAKHYAFHSSAKPHWPLSLRWCTLHSSESNEGDLLPLALRRELEGIDDDYQSVCFRPFVQMK